jgi:hypothetical protein
MSKVTQIPYTMIDEKINELKKCCKTEKTKNLFTNQYNLTHCNGPNAFRRLG